MSAESIDWAATSLADLRKKDFGYGDEVHRVSLERARSVYECAKENEESGMLLREELSLTEEQAGPAALHAQKLVARSVRLVWWRLVSVAMVWSRLKARRVRAWRRPRLLSALHALRAITEPSLRQDIVQRARLW